MPNLNIILGVESSTFFEKLRYVIGRNKQYFSQPHILEYERIEKEYNDHVKKHSNSEVIPNFTFEVSQSFYDTLFHKIFKEAFSLYHNPTKGVAKAMNELYRKLNDNENNEDFILNYSKYWAD